MKFAIFALIASVCLVSGASANIFQDWNADLMKFEKDVQGFKFFDWVESLFDDSADILKKILKDVEGVECFVNEAALIANLGQSSFQTIQSCVQSLDLSGSTELSEIKQGVQEIKTIVQLLKGFKITKIEDFQYKKLFAVGSKLLATVKNIVENAKTLVSTVSVEETCFKSTLDNLSSTLKGFPEKLKSCAKTA